MAKNFYFYNMRWIKTHIIIKKVFKNYIWNVPNDCKKIYLTFDDGPTPEITQWVLTELKKYNAKATFFCIGNNIQKYPQILNEILNHHHSVGNHTNNHLNGWKTASEKYILNVAYCENELQKFEQYKLQPKLFRAPYGKIKPAQAKMLRLLGYKIVMWDVISYDFDKSMSAQKCLQNVLQKTKSGSIIIFHDSNKAAANLKYTLPRLLADLTEKGFVFDKL